MAEYYISSTKYTIQERQTKKHGTVYDVVFRIVDQSGAEKQKRLSGYRTKREAKEAHAEFVAEHCEIRKGAAKKPAAEPKKRVTVAEAVERYLIVVESQLKVSSVYEKRKVFDRVILPFFDGKYMDEIDKQMMREYQDYLWSRRKSNGEPYAYSRNEKDRVFFSAFLSWASDVYDIHNYLTEIKKPRERRAKTEIEIWTREEFEQFISAVDDPLYKAFFSVLFWTGRRKGEVVALSPKDVLDGRIRWDKSITTKTLDAKYAVTTTKEDKSDVLPICDRARKAIEEYMPLVDDGAAFLFGGQDPIPFSSIDHAYDRYIRKSGVRKIRLHAFRHSFVSMLISEGASYQVVAKLISDNVEQVISTYAHLYEGDVDRAVERLNMI